jgi:uncharacterized membrane protein YraQ (UPF0718 family)
VENESVQRVIQFITDFTSIVYEAMPFIVLGAVIAGILEEFVPRELISRLIPRNRLLAILAGGLLGLVFPMCECGIIPIMRRLIRKGIPLSACTAYLLAGPIINVVVMGSTYTAFYGQENLKSVSGQSAHQMGPWMMMAMRMGLGYLVAVGTSLIVEWQYRKHGNSLLTPLATPPAELKVPVAQAALKADLAGAITASPGPAISLPLAEANGNGNGNGNADEEETPAAKKSWTDRLGNVTETALHDFVDIMVFLIIGALIAAFSRQALARGDIVDYVEARPILAILMMMGMAVLLCLCSEADAFVAASYTLLRPSAKIAFLVLGPMLDLKLYFMYTRVFRPRLIWTIFGSVAIQVFIYSVAVHYVWEYVVPQFDSAPAAVSTSKP